MRTFLLAALCCLFASSALAVVSITSAVGGYTLGVANLRDRFTTAVVLDENALLSSVSITNFPSNDAEECGISGVETSTTTLANNTLTMTLSPATDIGASFTIYCNYIVVGSSTGRKTSTLEIVDNASNKVTKKFTYDVTGALPLGYGGAKNKNGARYLASTSTLEFNTDPVLFSLDADSLNLQFSYYVSGVSPTPDSEMSCNFLVNGEGSGLTASFATEGTLSRVDFYPSKLLSGTDVLTMQCSPFDAPAAGTKATVNFYVEQAPPRLASSEDPAAPATPAPATPIGVVEVLKRPEVLAPSIVVPTEYYASQTGNVCADVFCSPAAAHGAAAAIGAALLAAAAMALAL